MIYPWLELPFNHLVGHGRALPHGVLLTGPKGIGKLFLAHQIARSLLCGAGEDGPSCNACKSCQLFSTGNHPDFHFLTNEQTVEASTPDLSVPGERYLIAANSRTASKRVIGVNQARALSGELRSTSHLGIGKVVIIYPADQLNLNAANALLKVLEEPTPDTHFLLVTAAFYAMPATIRSRCSHYRLPLPPENVVLEWLHETLSLDSRESMKLLAFSNGSPLEARKLFDNEEISTVNSFFPSDLAEILDGKETLASASKKWSQPDIQIAIRWLQREMLNAFRAGVGGIADESSRQVYDHLGREKCLALYQQIGEFLQWPPKAVDEMLFLESIIINMLKPNHVSSNES